MPETDFMIIFFEGSLILAPAQDIDAVQLIQRRHMYCSGRCNRPWIFDKASHSRIQWISTPMETSCVIKKARKAVESAKTPKHTIATEAHVEVAARQYALTVNVVNQIVPLATDSKNAVTREKLWLDDMVKYIQLCLDNVDPPSMPKEVLVAKRILYSICLQFCWIAEIPPLAGKCSGAQAVKVWTDLRNKLRSIVMTNGIAALVDDSEGDASGGNTNSDESVSNQLLKALDGGVVVPVDAMDCEAELVKLLVPAVVESLQQCLKTNPQHKPMKLHPALTHALNTCFDIGSDLQADLTPPSRLDGKTPADKDAITNFVQPIVEMVCSQIHSALKIDWLKIANQAKRCATADKVFPNWIRARYGILPDLASVEHLLAMRSSYASKMFVELLGEDGIFCDSLGKPGTIVLTLRQADIVPSLVCMDTLVQDRMQWMEVWSDLLVHIALASETEVALAKDVVDGLTKQVCETWCLGDKSVATDFVNRAESDNLSGTLSGTGDSETTLSCTAAKNQHHHVTLSELYNYMGEPPKADDADAASSASFSAAAQKKLSESIPSIALNRPPTMPILELLCMTIQAELYGIEFEDMNMYSNLAVDILADKHALFSDNPSPDMSILMTGHVDIIGGNHAYQVAKVVADGVSDIPIYINGERVKSISSKCVCPFWLVQTVPTNDDVSLLVLSQVASVFDPPSNVVITS